MTEILWHPGETCDVIIGHYKHGDLPLICYRIQSDPIGPRVRIHYETYWAGDVGREEDKNSVRHLWFTALVDDGILCPDGGWYPLDPETVKIKLNEILLERTDIYLYTQSGIITGLYCDEHAVIDTIYQGAHTIEINLTTRNLRDIPIGPGGANIWMPDGIVHEYSAWGVSKWQ